MSCYPGNMEGNRIDEERYRHRRSAKEPYKVDSTTLLVAERQGNLVGTVIRRLGRVAGQYLPSYSFAGLPTTGYSQTSGKSGRRLSRIKGRSKNTWVSRQRSEGGCPVLEFTGRRRIQAGRIICQIYQEHLEVD